MSRKGGETWGTAGVPSPKERWVAHTTRCSLCGEAEGFSAELFGRWLDQFPTFPLKPKPGLSGPPVLSPRGGSGPLRCQSRLALSGGGRPPQPSRGQREMAHSPAGPSGPQ